MINWLKRHFIPHVHNAYRPHFLIGENLRQLLGVIIGFELILFILPVLNFTQVVNTFNLGAVLPSVLSTLTNEERMQNNLSNLVVNPVLTHAAQMKAEDMAAKSYFAHTSPDGKTPWYWIDLAGYSYNYAGENLAVSFTDSKDVTTAWMNSPTHRANIVGGNYTEMGTGIATGMYEGRETVFVAQVYASPAVVNTPISNVEFLNPKQAPNPNIQITQTQIQTEEVLGEIAPAPQEPTFVQKTLLSPRDTTNTVLYVMLSFVLVALFLNIVIKFEHQHPDLITNGMVIAVIIFAIHLGNGYLSQKDLKVLSQNAIEIMCKQIIAGEINLSPKALFEEAKEEVKDISGKVLSKVTEESQKVLEKIPDIPETVATKLESFKKSEPIKASAAGEGEVLGVSTGQQSLTASAYNAGIDFLSLLFRHWMWTIGTLAVAAIIWSFRA